MDLVLTPRRRDALTELINIAFGRTAASLSSLSRDRVVIGVPEIEICSLERIEEKLGALLPGEIATVQQIFSGPVHGDALLLLDRLGAAQLSALMIGEHDAPGELDGGSREVIAEVGNILLNACLGMFSNMLKVHVTFSVPHLHVETLGVLLRSLRVDGQELRQALIAHTCFRLRGSEVSGSLMLILSVASFAWLLDGVEKWETEQASR